MTTTEALTTAVNPYPGFRPFEPEDEDFFFGREEPTDELLRRLDQCRLVAVLGVSGSGKSSLVRAGLVPQLHGGFLNVAARWQIAVMRPGGGPIQNLAEALAATTDAVGADDDHAAAGVSETGDAATPEDDALRTRLTAVTLRRGALGLVEAVRQMRLPEGTSLLLVVDQFEELFRFRQRRDLESNADEAVAFVKLLIEATQQTDLPIYVLLTMRSDFLGECADYPGLARAVNRGQYLIPRMTRDEMRLAIAGPARVVGARITERLSQRLLNDVGDDPAQLPLLQHALMRTWDHWRQQGEAGPIDVDQYQAIGGIEQAISLHAEEAFGELDPGDQRLCSRIFKGVTQRGGGHGATRRPTALAELAAIVGRRPDEIERVVGVFRQTGRCFLLPAAGSPLRSDSIIDIAHESLMRVWPRLAGWVEEERESVRTYARLAETAELHARGEAPLYWDPALQLALDWREREEPNEAWARRHSPGFARAMAFLDASDQKKRGLEEMARHARVREMRTSRLVAASFGLLLGLSMAAAAFGIWGLREAREIAKTMASYGTTVSRLGASIERNLLEARRHEKDFLLNWQTLGFEPAKDIHVTAIRDRLRLMQESVHELDGVLDEAATSMRSDEGTEITAGLREAIADLNPQFDIFRAALDEAIVAIERRGFKDSGLEGVFRARAHAMESTLTSFEAPELTTILLQLRRREKDYLLRGEQRYIDAVHAEGDRLGRAIDASDLPAPTRVQIQTQIDEYLRAFNDLVEQERTMERVGVRFRETAEHIQDRAATIRDLGLLEEDRALRQVEMEYEGQRVQTAIVMVIMAAVLTVGIVLSVVMFRLLRQPENVARLHGL